jgi:hypothetical protein
VVATVEPSSSNRKDVKGMAGKAALSSCKRHYPSSSSHAVMASKFSLPVGSMVGSPRVVWVVALRQQRF